MSTTEEHNIVNNHIEFPSLKEWGNSEWRSHAACYGSNTNDFFPDETGFVGNSKVAKSKLVCYTCRVREDCLGFAISNNIKHGVWGGLSPSDRRKVNAGNLSVATKTTVATVVRHLTVLKIRDKASEIARMARVTKEEAEEMLKDPKNTYI